MIKVSTINEDISLYIFGKPIDTDSVILTNEEKRNIDIKDITIPILMFIKLIKTPIVIINLLFIFLYNLFPYSLFIHL